MQRSTATAGTPSGATTPARTFSTGRCARCSATTCASRGRSSRPDRLRFDFSHFGPMTQEEIADVEDLVNAEVLAQRAGADLRDLARRRPRRTGAIAFFGDKYGERRARRRGRVTTRSSCAGART